MLAASDVTRFYSSHRRVKRKRNEWNHVMPAYVPPSFPRVFVYKPERGARCVPSGKVGWRIDGEIFSFLGGVVKLCPFDKQRTTTKLRKKVLEVHDESRH